MFWNDPNLYGVSMPYKDISNTMAMGGWHNIPRFLPPSYGLNAPCFGPQGLTPQGINPHQVTPFAPPVRPEAFTSPYFIPQGLPQQAVLPQTLPVQPFAPPVRPEAFTSPYFVPQGLPQQAALPQTLPVQPFGGQFRPEGFMPPAFGVNPYFSPFPMTPYVYNLIRPFIY